MRQGVWTAVVAAIIGTIVTVWLTDTLSQMRASSGLVADITYGEFYQLPKSATIFSDREQQADDLDKQREAVMKRLKSAETEKEIDRIGDEAKDLNDKAFKLRMEDNDIRANFSDIAPPMLQVADENHAQFVEITVRNEGRSVAEDASLYVPFQALYHVRQRGMFEPAIKNGQIHIGDIPPGAKEIVVLWHHGSFSEYGDDPAKISAYDKRGAGVVRVNAGPYDDLELWRRRNGLLASILLIVGAAALVVFTFAMIAGVVEQVVRRAARPSAAAPALDTNGRNEAASSRQTAEKTEAGRDAVRAD